MPLTPIPNPEAADREARAAHPRAVYWPEPSTPYTRYYLRPVLGEPLLAVTYRPSRGGYLVRPRRTSGGWSISFPTRGSYTAQAAWVAAYPYEATLAGLLPASCALWNRPPRLDAAVADALWAEVHRLCGSLSALAVRLGYVRSTLVEYRSSSYMSGHLGLLLAWACSHRPDLLERWGSEPRAGEGGMASVGPSDTPF